MWSRFLTVLTLVLGNVGMAVVLAGGEQPAQASALGQTGTEASPTGSLTPATTATPFPAQTRSQPTSGSAFAQAAEDVTMPSVGLCSTEKEAPTSGTATSPPPGVADAWKEIATQLRALSDAVRAFPQQCEERWLVVQRAASVAFAAGRIRGWWEGAGVVLMVLCFFWWLRSRRQ